KPNVHIRSLYGRGIDFTTNSRGFRNTYDASVAVPRGKVRIICSGDSFTLGYGVSDQHTWCHLLSSLKPGVETVNMGQGGYGGDQAYLWYMREGVKLEHQFQLLAFITGDIYRMQSASALGYDKPVLDIAAGRIGGKDARV